MLLPGRIPGAVKRFPVLAEEVLSLPFRQFPQDPLRVERILVMRFGGQRGHKTQASPWPSCRLVTWRSLPGERSVLLRLAPAQAALGGVIATAVRSRNMDMSRPPVIRGVDLIVQVNDRVQILETSSSIGIFLVISWMSEAQTNLLASRT